MRAPFPPSPSPPTGMSPPLFFLPCVRLVTSSLFLLGASLEGRARCVVMLSGCPRRRLEMVPGRPCRLAPREPPAAVRYAQAAIRHASQLVPAALTETVSRTGAVTTNERVPGLCFEPTRGTTVAPPKRGGLRDEHGGGRRDGRGGVPVCCLAARWGAFGISQVRQWERWAVEWRARPTREARLVGKGQGSLASAAPGAASVTHHRESTRERRWGRQVGFSASPSPMHAGRSSIVADWFGTGGPERIGQSCS